MFGKKLNEYGIIQPQINSYKETISMMPAFGKPMSKMIPWPENGYPIQPTCAEFNCSGLACLPLSALRLPI